ncbi:MAG: hypothetical protein ACK4FZ_11100 [Vogesella sp.]
MRSRNRRRRWRQHWSRLQSASTMLAIAPRKPTSWCAPPVTAPAVAAR